MGKLLVVNRGFGALLLIANLAVIVAACSPNSNGEAILSSRDGGIEDGRGRLTVYSGRSESLVQPIIDRFTSEMGIEVDVRYGGTAELAATLLEEGDKSPADIFYAQDPGGLGIIQESGLFRPLPDSIIDRVPARFASPESKWVGISGRARVIVFNTDRVDAGDLPEDIWGFTEPEWSGRIGWAPTNGSFQAMVTGMRTIWGDDQTRAWLSGIQENNPIQYEKNTPIVDAVGRGEVDVGFVNHYYLHRFMEEQGESFSARNYYLPGGGPGSLVMVSGAGILNTSRNIQNSERLIDFLLSEGGQQYFTDETYEYPVIEGIKTSPLLRSLSEIDTLAPDIQPADLADLEGTVGLMSEIGILP
jgi:iron(III) transport system substrate-binding protein